MSLMKTLIVTGSLRKKGNTERACEVFAEKLAESAERLGLHVQMELYRLSEHRIEACLGCRTCFDRGEEFCPIKDETTSFRTNIREADCLVLASPVYINDLSGALKNTLDRMVYACHRPEFAGKIAAILCTTGSTSASHAIRSIKVALMTWGFKTVGTTQVVLGALASYATLRLRCEKPLIELALKTTNALAKLPHIKPDFVSLLVFRIQQAGWRKGLSGKADREFIAKSGWLNKHTTYYVPHHAPFLKVRFARIVGMIVGAIMN
jgi:multimeric flavodoxin WrbA